VQVGQKNCPLLFVFLFAIIPLLTVFSLVECIGRLTSFFVSFPKKLQQRKERQSMAAVKLYVGNLPWSATSDQLQQMFAQAGVVVSAQVVTDKFTGRSRGFAFVEMADEAAAQAAITQLNNTAMDGRNIVVNIAKPPEERPERRNFRPDRRYDNRGGGQGDRYGR
jgi:cold-inducible RNA-binding protein